MGDNYFIELSIRALGDLDIPFEIKIFSFTISFICLSTIMYLNYRMRRLGSTSIVESKLQVGSLPPVQERGIAGRWQEIQKHVQSDRDGEWKFAIIEADKLVDDILSEIGIAGDTLGEKLTQINSSQLAAIDDLWEAHRVRNKIAHDSQYFLRDVEARRIVDLFEKVLRELEAL